MSYGLSKRLTSKRKSSNATRRQEEAMWYVLPSTPKSSKSFLNGKVWMSLLSKVTRRSISTKVFI